MNKSFLRGMSEAINLFPQERRVTVSLPGLSNEEAFRKDLEQVGADMYFAIQLIEQSGSRNQLDEKTKEIRHSAQN